MKPLIAATYFLLLRHVESAAKCISTLSQSLTIRIREFSSDVPIYMFTPDGNYEMMTLQELLPNSFGPENILSPEDLSKRKL